MHCSKMAGRTTRKHRRSQALSGTGSQTKASTHILVLCKIPIPVRISTSALFSSVCFFFTLQKLFSPFMIYKFMLWFIINSTSLLEVIAHHTDTYLYLLSLALALSIHNKLSFCSWQFKFFCGVSVLEAVSTGLTRHHHLRGVDGRVVEGGELCVVVYGGPDTRCRINGCCGNNK